MRIEEHINRTIDKNLLEDEKQKKANWKSSGKLSASRLGWPLQHLILHSLGIEGTPFDPYTLRKFLRGRTVEDWLVTQVPGVVETQKFVEYKQTVGYVDIVVDSKDYDHKLGVIPHEVKSVTNAKFKRLNGAPDDQHCLQACLYALALGSDHFAIDYVAADDLRVKSYIVETKEYADRVENIIKEYHEVKKSRIIPEFVPLYSWQKNKMYNAYPQYMNLSLEEVQEKAERELKLKNEEN